MATGEGHGLGVDSNDDGEHFHLLNERLMLHAAYHEVLWGHVQKGRCIQYDATRSYHEALSVGLRKCALLHLVTL